MMLVTRIKSLVFARVSADPYSGGMMADETLVGDDVRVATGGWWLFLLVGLLSLVVGITILFKPGDSLATLALAASLMHSTQNRGMVALLGALTSIVGVLLIRHPVQGVVFVALLIGIWLIAVGVIRFVASFEMVEYRGWNMIAGLVELIAGIVIVSNPNIGYATLAVLVGIAFIVNGIGISALGWSMSTLRRAAQ
jgi:uncharacterized membrane protein HdeD (DUF308 family)